MYIPRRSRKGILLENKSQPARSMGATMECLPRQPAKQKHTVKKNERTTSCVLHLPAAFCYLLFLPVPTDRLNNTCPEYRCNFLLHLLLQVSWRVLTLSFFSLSCKHYRYRRLKDVVSQGSTALILLYCKRYRPPLLYRCLAVTPTDGALWQQDGKRRPLCGTKFRTPKCFSLLPLKDTNTFFLSAGFEQTSLHHLFPRP